MKKQWFKSNVSIFFLVSQILNGAFFLIPMISQAETTQALVFEVPEQNKNIFFVVDYKINDKNGAICGAGGLEARRPKFFQSTEIKPADSISNLIIDVWQICMKREIAWVYSEIAQMNKNLDPLSKGLGCKPINAKNVALGHARDFCVKGKLFLGLGRKSKETIPSDSQESRPGVK